MIKHILQTIFVLNYTVIVIAQINQPFVVEATLFDSIDRNTINYANIGILNKSVGTVSNHEGWFSLIIPDSLTNEKITISRIGYETTTIPIKDWKANPSKNLYLKPISYQLEEVIVKAKSSKIKTVGNFSKKGVVIAINSESKGREIGTVIKIPKNKTAFLKDFNFNILANNPDSAIFRLNIYKDENKAFKNILNEDIYIVLKKGVTGPYRVDLTAYNIEANSDIFVTLEFLDLFSHIEKKDLQGADIFFYDRINITGTLFGSKSYYRSTSHSKWEKIPKACSPSFWMTISY